MAGVIIALTIAAAATLLVAIVSERKPRPSKGKPCMIPSWEIIRAMRDGVWR